ncbi:MAG TPA: UDP-3-O-(3-hydroxymyristoyl)glucosamine N-acyltransferase [Rhizomicrobium sp.]|nr:UDP-3-O-(3-hydroxymyristoyl)glucosamine N-acyltransferase [Rhizomicrobium sp.]
MADPRFFKNLGPFTLARICEKAGIAVPAGAEAQREFFDLADLAGSDSRHLTFFSGNYGLRDAFAASRAGACLVAENARRPVAPGGMIVLETSSVAHAFAAVAAMFYPEHSQPLWQAGEPAISPKARIGGNVMLAPGVTVGAGAEIGNDTRIGPGAVIGPGVAIGRNCEIGANVSISHAYIGDRAIILPGARIGQPGFGFASRGAEYLKIPQLGRVIVQDDVEIGANTTIDRGALSDTVIGEGSKLDNLIMIAHNCRVGRHCVIAGQTGLAGSVILEDGVVLAGQVGLGDHSRVGAGARMGARSGTGSAIYLEGGVDYGGAPAKPVREWAREIHALARLGKQRKQDKNE